MNKKIYHELMAEKVKDILLVSSPYDAFIMEEEGRLSARIISEYKGLNLSSPPRLTLASSASEAFQLLEKMKFDFILAMPGLDEMQVHDFADIVKSRYMEIPFFMLLHDTCDIGNYAREHASGSVDRTYIWGGNADLLLAIIKNFEDRMNVARDTKKTGVRVIILVEDSPYHYSAFLPVLYKQIVLQTQSVIEDSINEDQRILKMRGRPKVLLAQDYESAMALYKKYAPYILSVFSDMRFPYKGKSSDNAGYHLLKEIKSLSPDLPVLTLSTEEHNREKVKVIPSTFINKNSNNLHDQIKTFFVSSLGFGAFVFKMPGGEEIARVSDMKAMERMLSEIPDESIVYHALNNDFSRWFMARSEIDFALKLKPYKITDFSAPRKLKDFLINSIHTRRKGSRQGQIIDFDSQGFDGDTDFIKIGTGSLGGKARGLAFMAFQLKKDPVFETAFPEIEINIPQTFVVSTEGFTSFIEENRLFDILKEDPPPSDCEIQQRFLGASLPDWLIKNLKIYLQNVSYPIAVRSSSLFEDAHYQPFAGLYSTLMLPNQDPSLEIRLKQLITAVKLVYASTYFAAPRSYAKSTMHRTEDEQMAVVLQQMTGSIHDGYFYPALSGVAQSHNFYPIGRLKAEDGISHLALGIGKIVMEGGQALRFCQKHPNFMPQFSMIDDILNNSQKSFYALRMESFPDTSDFISTQKTDLTLAKIDLTDAIHHPVVQSLCSTFYPHDNRIRDNFSEDGLPVLTFASVLKYETIPLARILDTATQIGRKWMGGAVEIEFALSFPVQTDKKPRFSLLQIRPMGRYKQNLGVKIKRHHIEKAFCYSTKALGNGEDNDIQDIIYIDPDRFDSGKTIEIASEINKMNAYFNHTNRKYILVGPGRWGSSDRWLGIPVTWNDISNVGVIVETTIETIKADPSQGSHFFQNITSLGISYLNIPQTPPDFIDYRYFQCQHCENTTEYLKHIHFEHPVRVMVDGKTAQAVICPYEPDATTEKMDDIPDTLNGQTL